MNLLQNGQRSRKYNPKIRTFALTLHFYSPKGYKYVRSIFNNALPSVSTIRKWYSVIDGKPGFSSEAFTVLKCKANEANIKGQEILGCLIFDEMAIRKQIEYEQHTDEPIGCVNFGTNDIGTDTTKYAKEVLVFLVAGVSEKFKIPVAYFLISGLKSAEKAALLQEVILLVSKTGVKIVGLTFDGLASNLATARALGADFKNEKTYIANPHSDDKIYLYPDACHMLKLARNCLAGKKVLLDNDGNSIEWRYIVELDQYQRTNEINLGNKITKLHAIHWDKKKMSVRIAAETLSNGTADAIEFLNSKKIPEFNGCEATVEFIRRINNVFDILNSKDDSKNGFKRPISVETKEDYFKYFDESINYFQGLKLHLNGRSILTTKSKTPFLGFIIDLKNFRSFYFEYVESSILDRIYTFRFSQDHLELIFGCIRQMFGCNDNPSAKQFESAWRRLLGQHQITASENSNCANNDTMFLSVLNTSSRKHTNRDIFHDVSLYDSTNENNNNTIDDNNENDDLVLVNAIVSDCSSESDIDLHMIAYFASVLQNRIIDGRWYSPLKCEKCLNVFLEDELIDDPFVNLKIKTKNIHPPAMSTTKICFETDKAIQNYGYEVGAYSFILDEVNRVLDHETLFPNSDFEQHAESDHKKTLITLIIRMYFERKQEYISKCKTLTIHNIFWRSYLLKYTHHEGQ